MSKKLILIDGSSMLSTSFFGNVPKDYHISGDTKNLMQTSYGLFTNGVFTMSKILLNIFNNQKPTHIAICWDVNRTSLFRRQIYPEYKAHRKETKPELSSQFQLMQELLEKMNIPQFKFEGHEADDIIGTLTKQFEKEIPIYIMTKDQDALQLISEYTRVWLTTSKSSDMYKERNINIKEFNLPDGVFEYTNLTFEEEYGIKPIQMIDKKAIEGDKSDNIPGVKGVGEKAVIPLLQEFATLEEIYNNIENISKEEEDELKALFKKLGISQSPIKKLIENKDNAFLSKKLATIDTNISELKSIEIDDLVFNLNHQKMLEEFNRLEFKSLIEKINNPQSNDSDNINKNISYKKDNKPNKVDKVNEDNGLIQDSFW